MLWQKESEVYAYIDQNKYTLKQTFTVYRGVVPGGVVPSDFDQSVNGEQIMPTK